MSLLDKYQDFLSKNQHCKITICIYRSLLANFAGISGFPQLYYRPDWVWYLIPLLSGVVCLFVCWYKCVDLSPHSGRCSQIGGWVIWCWLIEIKKSHERGNPKRQIVANWSKTRRLCPENCTSFRAISWQTDFIFNPQLTSCKLRGAISALSSSEQIPVNYIWALGIKLVWHWHW